jgi:hypothetical protein
MQSFNIKGRDCVMNRVIDGRTIVPEDVLIGCEVVDWIQVAQYRAIVNTAVIFSGC